MLQSLHTIINKSLTLQLKMFDNAEPAGFIELQRTLCYTLCPRFKSHQCLFFFSCRSTFSCHASCQEVSRCHTRGESEESIAHRQWNMQARDSSWPWNPRADVTRCPKQGYEWPHKKDLCPQKLFKKKFDNGIGGRCKKSVALFMRHFLCQGLNSY